MLSAALSVLARESNAKVFVTGYVLAKALVLTGLSAVQSALFLWVGNSILEIHEMFLIYLGTARRVMEISRASTGPSSSMVYSPIRLRTRPRKVRTAQMPTIVAMFFGLTGAASEVLKDRALLKRESNAKVKGRIPPPAAHAPA